MEAHSSIELKIINLHRVFNCIYDLRTASKLDIAVNTGLSIPTVSSNLKELQENGLVKDDGMQESTGGRKAQCFSVNSTARVAIGTEILKSGIRILALDLYGNILAENHVEYDFHNTAEYLEHFGSLVNKFAEDLNVSDSCILGVGIALQGLISDNGETVQYSEILKATGLKLSQFQQYVNYKCVMLHDTEVAAFAEIWQQDVDSVIYLALNRNFGGTIVVNKEIAKNRLISSGTIEHMCLDVNGPDCYCGKNGCVETYCSANRLRTLADMPLEDFFKAVHDNDSRCTKIWRSYIKYLSVAMDNLRMIADCEFIIGGYLVEFMNEDDFALLKETVKLQCYDSRKDCRIRRSIYGDKAPAIGAGAFLINDFIKKGYRK